MAQDYYKTLGIGKSASAEEIQKTYRKLARKHHPDLNPDDKLAKSRFQEIQTAYDTLNDPEKRKLYDQFGADYERMTAGGSPFQGAGGPGGVQFDFGDLFGQGGAGGVDLGDLFRKFGGQGGPTAARGRRSAGPANGADLTAEITIPFNTAVLGGEANIAVQRTNVPETIQVRIPAGVDDGQKIRLRGQGQPAAGGQPGDLLLTVHIAPHPFFKRTGKNLELRLPVTIEEAALGTKIDLPTPGGAVTLTIPPMSSSGRRLRVKGQGVRSKDGSTGDLFVELSIKLPEGLDEQAKGWLSQIGKQYTQPLREGLVW